MKKIAQSIKMAMSVRTSGYGRFWYLYGQL